MHWARVWPRHPCDSHSHYCAVCNVLIFTGLCLNQFENLLLMDFFCMHRINMDAKQYEKKRERNRAHYTISCFSFLSLSIWRSVFCRTELSVFLLLVNWKCRCRHFVVCKATKKIITLVWTHLNNKIVKTLPR